MAWFSNLFGNKSLVDDPIMKLCRSIASQNYVTITPQEISHVLYERDKLADSSLGGAYIHKDVFHMLCFLCLFDGLFEAGIELTQRNEFAQASDTLEKVKQLLPWPTVLLALGMCHMHLDGELDLAYGNFLKAIDGFDMRYSLLSNIVPQTIPDRNIFIESTGQRIDITGSLALNIRDIKSLHFKLKELIKDLEDVLNFKN